MMRRFFIIPALILLSSCATIINGPKTRVDVITNIPARVVYQKDTLIPFDNRTKMLVTRDIQPLVLKVLNDSISKTIMVDSRNSAAYLLNLCYSWGIGMLFESLQRIHLTMNT